jgi:hypothetical protein
VADTDFVEFGGISEDEIKKSLMVEVKRRKCWNAKTIEKMTFEEVINTACYHVSSARTKAFYTYSYI